MLRYLASRLGRLPAHPIIHLFANVFCCKTVALPDLVFEFVAPAIDDKKVIVG